MALEHTVGFAQRTVGATQSVDAKPGGAADPDDTEAPTSALQLVEQRGREDRAGCPKRMAHGDRAAVDVEALRPNPEVTLELEAHCGEGLGELEQVEAARDAG